MSHPDAFLKDILAYPRDDRPRLLYAQWLDDRCDPLGEFIRVQCQLARHDTDAVHGLELETRERELLAEYEQEWAGGLAGIVDFWVFRRGFVQEIGITADRFLDHADELFAHSPILEVHLGRVRDRLNSLAASSYLQRPKYLDLSNNALRDSGIKMLANSPYLSRLEGINLSSSGIGDAGLKALAASPYLPRLRELYLCDNRIGDAGVRALAQSPLANQLETLHLRFNAIGHDGAQLLQNRLGLRVTM